MSVGIRVAVIALAVAGLSGLASAQTYYPPPPPGYYPHSPGYYPPPPDYDAPVPPTDVGGPSDQPYYGAGMEERGQETLTRILTGIPAAIPATLSAGTAGLRGSG